MAKSMRTPLGSVRAAGEGGGYGSSWVDISVVGVREAIAKLGRVSQLVYMRTGNVVYNTAQMAEKLAKEYVHSRENPWSDDYAYTNFLKDSIDIEKNGPYDWAVYAGAEYAEFEEYSPGHEFLRPAAYAALPWAQAQLHVLAREIEMI